MILGRLKRILVGQPLTSQAVEQELIPKWKALATLSSDALSSVAYATDASLAVLVAFSTAALAWSIPIAGAITALLVVLTASYRQTIMAYPGGGGAYAVAKENLGSNAALVAATALMIDYVLTVAVSVSAGVENIGSAFPILAEHKVLVGSIVVVGIMLANLRGMRESATFFAFPTYFFIVSVFVLIAGGLWRYATGSLVSAEPLVPTIYPAVPMVLVLRAFGSGCAALTGVEAISNSVPVFRPPGGRNAKITLTWMAFILAALFLGISVLAHMTGVIPREGQTVISLLGHAVFGNTMMYYCIQIATALILFLAANTSYISFPRLASVLAKDGYVPRQMSSQGDRLVFSNGIVGLSAAAIGLLFVFGGDTLEMIPLYAIGVFLSFTLSQSGMVIHHLREQKPAWIRSLTINALGAVTTFIVLSDIAWSKFTHGAWIVVLVIPIFVFALRAIRHHYRSVGEELSLLHETPWARPEPMRHVVIIPVSGVHRGVLGAIRYALSISQDVRACYVETDPVTTEVVRHEWEKWAPEIPFVTLKSPYRSVMSPFLHYIDELRRESWDDMITVLIPEFVTTHWWHRFLHNQTAVFMRQALASRRRVVVTTVRYHLRA